MQMNGGCLCGTLRYSVSAAPVFQVICHCRMCQKASGGPFMALAFVPPESIEVTKGKKHRGDEGQDEDHSDLVRLSTALLR